MGTGIRTWLGTSPINGILVKGRQCLKVVSVCLMIGISATFR